MRNLKSDVTRLVVKSGTYLTTCLPRYFLLSCYQPSHLTTYLLTYLLTYLDTSFHQTTNQNTYLPTYILEYLPTYLPTYPSIYLSTYQTSTYLPIYLSIYLLTYLPINLPKHASRGSKQHFILTLLNRIFTSKIKISVSINYFEFFGHEI